ELHGRAIVHRDLKPGNVLLDRHDPSAADVRLADLGLAKVRTDAAAGVPSLEHLSTGASALLGTWEYMPPEQWIKSKTVGPKADVYALGVLLFEMLAGKVPFMPGEAKDLMYFHLFERPPIDRIPHEVPPMLTELVERMLDKAAPPRPSAGEVVERLS